MLFSRRVGSVRLCSAVFCTFSLVSAVLRATLPYTPVRYRAGFKRLAQYFLFLSFVLSFFFSDSLLLCFSLISTPLFLCYRSFASLSSSPLRLFRALLYCRVSSFLNISLARVYPFSFFSRVVLLCFCAFRFPSLLHCSTFEHVSFGQLVNTRTSSFFTLQIFYQSC